jgi:transmembrane sensor
MKEMKNNEKYSDREWEELASLLSGEKDEQSDLLGRFIAADSTETVKKWKELRNMSDEKEINVDNAWKNVYTRMNEESDKSEIGIVRKRFTRSSFMRVAATALVLLSLGIAGTYFLNPDIFSRKITVATNDDQKNIRVALPDGSSVFLNRNSELSYRSNFGSRGRNVMLTGEAFFEISHDASNPFVIDAGKANIRVVGTSFNVITMNNESAVEVFVKTGKVMLSNNSGSESVALEPGYIGTMDSGLSEKTLNTNPNYLSWNTGLLIYNGQKLDVVFKDLKRVYNMDIEVSDPAILENEWTSPIDNQPRDTIIRLICASFNLSSTKDGNVYRLAKK